MKVRWTDKANRELLEFVAYVYPHNRMSALNLYGLVRTKVLQLKAFPKSGRIGRMDGTRELVIRDTPYIAVSVIKDDTVWIAHVIHTSQQWPPEEE